MNTFIRNILVGFILTIVLSFTAQAQRATTTTDIIQTNVGVQIEIRGIPQDDASQISRKYALDKSGTVRLLHLPGPIKISGMTTRAAEDLIASAYVRAGIYTAPIVSVIAQQRQLGDAEHRILISGRVGKSGEQPYREGITLIEAVLVAGDINLDWGSRYILLTRQNQTKKYDYFSVRDRNVVLLPNDVIHVPDRPGFEGRPTNLLP